MAAPQSGSVSVSRPGANSWFRVPSLKRSVSRCQVAPDDQIRPVPIPEIGQARTNIGLGNGASQEKSDKERGPTQELPHLPGQVSSAVLQGTSADGKAQGTLAMKAMVSVPRITKAEWLHIFETTGLCRVRGISAIQTQTFSSQLERCYESNI